MAINITFLFSYIYHYRFIHYQCSIQHNNINTSTNYKCFTVVCVYFDQYTDPPSTPSPEGLVYPPITDVTVSYTDSVDMLTVTVCADLSTDDDSCSFNVSLTEDDSQPMYMFDVSVEVSNLGGSSLSQRTFESEKL